MKLITSRRILREINLFTMTWLNINEHDLIIHTVFIISIYLVYI